MAAETTHLRAERAKEGRGHESTASNVYERWMWVMRVVVSSVSGSGNVEWRVTDESLWC